MNPDLIETYKQRRLMLFVGAGVSANLGLPPWSELIAHLADELDYDPAIFSTYGNHLALAEFYKNQNRGTIKDLKAWMLREWHDNSVSVEDSPVHELIAKSNFSRIYTTNYDRWLEIAHEHFGVPFRKIASAADLPAISDARRQIVKFHGDLDEDAPLVLGETSYYERLKFDSPLDIKLKNDALHDSILFVGYSMSDINIRLLFHHLSKIWNDDLTAPNRPRSYVLTHRQNPVTESILNSWGIDVIVSESDNAATGLLSFLEALNGCVHVDSPCESRDSQTHAP